MSTNYYLRIPLEFKDGESKIHIGKQSGGWKFASNMSMQIFSLLMLAYPLSYVEDEFGKRYQPVKFVIKVGHDWCYPLAKTPADQLRHTDGWS